jgi:cobalt/nickel transport protein
MEKKDAAITLTLSFSHPMEMVGMPLSPRPRSRSSLMAKRSGTQRRLKARPGHGSSGLDRRYEIKKPGVYQFVMEPTPYWEPAEDCFIVHYTKTVVPAFGEEEGWDEPLGLKTEIVPLTRPFGNYAGNVFQGQVLLDGKARARRRRRGGVLQPGRASTKRQTTT